MKYLAITGRQKELSIAELEATLGSDAIIEVTDSGIVTSRSPAVNHLGSIPKVFQLSIVASNTPLLDYAKKYVKENKVTSRLNLAVNNLSPKALTKLKKQLQSEGVNVRTVTGKGKVLTTAESVNNSMHSKKGLELMLVDIAGQQWVGELTQVQNLKSYTQRDQRRPSRDSKVGMLPPKLAQIIINLARGSHRKENTWVLDPFCGTGVLLQEALLMGCSAYGTDLSERMVEYSQANIDWLSKKHSLSGSLKLEKANAVSHQWSQFDTVACETYLGEAFSGPVTEAAVIKEVQSINKLLTSFLENIGNQLQSGARICIAVPQWQLNNQIFSLELVDNLSSLGYTWSEFSHVNVKELVYRRPGQLVGRQLLNLVKE